MEGQAKVAAYPRPHCHSGMDTSPTSFRPCDPPVVSKEGEEEQRVDGAKGQLCAGGFFCEQPVGSNRQSENFTDYTKGVET